MPGCLIAIARLNRPAVFVYGGTIMPGNYNGKDVDVVSVFEAVGAHANNDISDAQLKKIESCAIPGPGIMRWYVHGKHDGFSPLKPLE